MLTAEVNAPSVAVNVYVPGRSMLQPANAATPATAAFGFAVHANVAPPALVSANVTELVSLTIVLPDESCTVTDGCVRERGAAGRGSARLHREGELRRGRGRDHADRADPRTINAPSVAVNV